MDVDSTKEEEQNMGEYITNFYYDKDRYGTEHCYEVENIQEDAADRLQRMDDEAAFAVTIIHDGDIYGYKTLDEVFENEVKEAEPSSSWHYIYDALEQAINVEKLAFPFALIRHDCVTWECCPVEKVDYVEVMGEYVDYGHYRIQPGYYREGELTSEEADKQGMYALAKEIRQLGKLTIESVTPYKYIVSSYEFDKLIHTETIDIERPEEADCDDTETKISDMLYNFRMQLEDKFPEYPNEDELENFVWETLEDELGCDAVTVQ